MYSRRDDIFDSRLKKYPDRPEVPLSVKWQGIGVNSSVDGDRMHAELYIAEARRGALYSRQDRIEGIYHLKKLQEMGVDLSMLGPHGNVGRWGAEEINNKRIDVLKSINHETERIGALQSALLNENARRMDQGESATKPRFERYELGRISQYAGEEKRADKLPELFSHEVEYNFRAPAGQQFDMREVMGHRSADALEAYLKFHISLERLSALNNLSALRGEVINKSPVVREHFDRYSEIVSSDFSSSRKNMIEALKFAESSARWVGGVETRELKPELWDGFERAEVTIAKPYFRFGQVMGVKSFAEAQGDPARREHFGGLIRGGEVATYESRPRGNEIGLQGQRESREAFERGGGPTR